ncbi:hypothetical protein NUU61_000739 [Penicillium alfredii]|uniref:Uncharacterized protein n=1 Tax=Penicillium alfredii TaxID=1506179 RepID=A0A9W9GBH2_9EURO|nr:uncharacterized protein NUU61_000739 [Penicillium alfredii]KAJ5114980.1 hypothetical protein NUU61_000739 [Penicillium alfredii]
MPGKGPCQESAEHGAVRPPRGELQDVPTENPRAPNRLVEPIRESLVRDTEPQEPIPHKRARHEYERRPRHKTREDRYDYKAPGSGAGIRQKSNKEKKKRPRRRKNIMHDELRAANVTQERLTLRHTANLGFFNKGRSSSSAKPHEAVPDLVFSEMNFLSRTGHGLNHSTMVIESQKPKTEDGKVHQRQQLPSALPRLIPPNDTSGTPHFFAPSDSQCRETQMGVHEPWQVPRDLQHEKNKKVEAPQSATPYTWSGSNIGESQRDRIMDLYLLDLLHAGLHTQRIGDDDTATSRGKRYLKLEELKGILEERKACWGSGCVEEDSSSNGFSMKFLERSQPFNNLPEIGFNGDLPHAPHSTQRMPEYCTEEGQLGSNGGGNVPTERTGLSPALEPADTAKCEEQTLTSLAHGRKKNDPQIPLTMAADLIQVGADDDEVFYRTLDAAYRTIVSTGDKDQDFGQCHSNSAAPPRLSGIETDSQPNALLDSLTLSLLGFADTTWRQVYDYPDHPVLIDPHSLHEGLEKGPTVSTQRRPSSFLPPEENVEQSPGWARTATTLTASYPWPLGFWRQNKLY